MTAEVSFARRVRQLADERPDELVCRHIGVDGHEVALDLARARPPVEPARRAPSPTAGSGLGDRLVARPAQLPAVRAERPGGVEARRRARAGALGPARLGAGPGPRRDRARGPPRRRRRRRGSTPRPTSTCPTCPTRSSPQVNGICSSGSTGTPKVILSERPGDLRRGARHAVHRGVAAGRPARRRSSCRRRCTTPTGSPRCSACSPATGWWCSSGSTPPGSSTLIERHRVTDVHGHARRCCSASPTCPASTTATCRASTGSCRARRPCRRRSCTAGSTSSAPSASSWRTA